MNNSAQQISLTPKFSFFSLLKKAALGLIGLIFLIFLSYLLILIFEPHSQVLRLNLTNVSNHQLAISWVTDAPTRGVVVLSKDNHFPLLPILAKNILKDDGEKNLTKTGFYTTHHVTAANLEPNFKYYFRVYQGFRIMAEGSVKTSGELDSLTPPDPVYGKILTAKKTPAVGAIVYLWVQNNSTSSATLSTLTNSKGGWSLDLANLRTKDNSQKFKATSKSVEKIMVEGGSLGRFQAESKIGQDKPWPDVVLKK